MAATTEFEHYLSCMSLVTGNCAGERGESFDSWNAPAIARVAEHGVRCGEQHGSCGERNERTRDGEPREADNTPSEIKHGTHVGNESDEEEGND